MSSRRGNRRTHSAAQRWEVVGQGPEPVSLSPQGTAALASIWRLSWGRLKQSSLMSPLAHVRLPRLLDLDFPCLLTKATMSDSDITQFRPSFVAGIRPLFASTLR